MKKNRADHRTARVWRTRAFLGVVSAVAMSQAIFAMTASAHHAIITPAIACANGSQVVTWTISNSETTAGSNRSMVINAINISGGNSIVGIGVGSIVTPRPAPGSTVDATTTLPGNFAGNVTLTGVSSWIDSAGHAAGPQNQALPATSIVAGGHCTLPSTVGVALGACVYDGNFTSHTPVNVNISPADSAVVTISNAAAGVVAFSRSGTANLAPGDYDWSATPAAGYALTGANHGTLHVGDCSPHETHVAVALGTCVYDGNFSSHTPVTVTITPDGSSTVTITDAAGPRLFTHSGTANLAPGDYTWTATANPGSQLTGVTHGTLHVGDCSPQRASVDVALGSCVYDGNFTSHTPVTVTINPASGATLTISNAGGAVATFTHSGTADLPPGDYTWSATAANGYEMTGTRHGTLHVGDCSPHRAEASTALGACQYDGNFVSHTPANVTMTPAGAAIVTIRNAAGVVAALTAAGTRDLAPGDYTWTAVAATGYEMTGITHGDLHVGDCSPQRTTVKVELGGCVYDGNFTSHTPVTVTIDPNSAATVVISDASGVVKTFTQSGTADLAPGDYTWVATEGAGYEIAGPKTGSMHVGDCSPAPATVTVSLDNCVYDGNFTSHTPVNVTIDPAGSSTVTISNAAGAVQTFTATGTADLPPGDYTWAAAAATGYQLTGTTSGTLNVADCSPNVAGASIALAPCALVNKVPRSKLSVDVSTAGAVVVEILNSAGHTIGTVSQDSILSLPNGTYTWRAVAANGYQLSGTTAGTFKTKACVLGTQFLPKTGVGAASAGIVFLLLAGACVLGYGAGGEQIARVIARRRDTK
jgi:hypothetical protein